MENRKVNAPGRPYLKGFVRSAVALAKRLGSCVLAAKELGVHVNTVRGWVRAARKASKK